MRPLLSLCMIVKDEEKILDRCLSSMKDYVDEIIILDTGSTDATVDIARKYTPHIHHFQWVNDFAAARNASIEYATGTWILVLDADEYMEPNDAKKLREFIQGEAPTPNFIYCLPIVSHLGGGHTTNVTEDPVGRLFPHRMGFYFHRPIHEQITSSRGLSIKYVNIPHIIQHSGYTDEILAAKNKHERNLTIFRQLKDRQGQYTIYDHLMIASQYMMMKEYDEALPHLEKTLGKESELGTAYNRVLLSFVQLYINTQRFIDAWAFIEKHIPDYKQYSDIQAIRGIIYYHLGFYKEAKDSFLLCLSLGEEAVHAGKPHYIFLPILGVKFSLHYLSILFEREKSFKESVSCLTKLYGTFKDVGALSRLIRLLALRDDTLLIASFLGKLLNLQEPLSIPLLCKIAISQGHTELSQYYYQLLPSPLLLPLTDRLRFSLIVNDQVGFQRIWHESTEDQQQDTQAVYHLILAAVAWKQITWLKWLDALTLNENNKSLVKWAGRFLNSNEPEEPSKTSDTHTYNLLNGLYTINHMDAFDDILERVHSTAVLNQIADMLYKIHHDGAAMQCYEYLKEYGALEHSGYMNLAISSINTGELDAATQYLERAIQLNPQGKDLYILYCTVCLNPMRRKRMKQQLLQLDAYYKKFPPFLAL